MGFKNTHYLIKNTIKEQFQKDFSFNPYTSILFILFISVGFFFMYCSGVVHFWDLVAFLCFPFILTFVYIFAGRWETIVKLSFLMVFLLLWWKGLHSLYFIVPLVIGAFMAPVIQVAKEWERAVVLRFGKFQKVRGPGLFFLIPLIDNVIRIVDMRIRVTDFVAETTLTKDSVPVTVDALAFWLVWDAEKAILEVADYTDAVVMSSQTALREAIGKNSLAVLLENSDDIRESIRAAVDKKTAEWGITIQEIEITEIKVPEQLQNRLSIAAQAEREKTARILLGEAEIELAKKFQQAAQYYRDDERALQLRKMNILNEGLKEGNTMIIPETIVAKLEKEAFFGIGAWQELNELKKRQSKEEKDER